MSTKRDWKTKSARGLVGEPGLALVEVLIAGLIIGITALGLALFATWSQVFVVARGDDRVALFLAEQKLEKMRVWGFDGVLVLGPDDGGATSGCPDSEPCYSGITETITTGSVAGATLQTFTRRTCVDYVVDVPPYPATCTPGGGATFTKRVRVEVIPTMKQVDGATLETVLVSPPTPP